MKFTTLDTDEPEELFQITAMVDVVFILLAFFVLSVRFHGAEHDIATDFGERQHSAGAAAEDLPSSIVVRLSRSDSGGALITVGKTRLPENDYQALTAKLNQINLPAVSVLIAGDPALSIDQVARALDAALRSAMKKVALSATLPSVQSNGSP